MNLETIKKYLQSIEANKYDPETAHSTEDDLYHEFIQHVAKVGSPELQAMASECLKTQDIKFERWCA